VRPFYVTRDRHTELQVAAMQRSWDEHGARHDQSWFRSWVEVDELLGRGPTRPPILGYAMLSYSSAWTRRLLEFAIPEFVRAAEGVIAIPRAARDRNGASMQETFCERARRLAPRLARDEYIGADFDALLPKLYQLRSDCVHGKLPFAGMQAFGEAGKDQAAQLNYVAEVLAREALLLALRRQDWSIFESREVLESAWATGAFP
jgi:hypothetical protein